VVKPFINIYYINSYRHNRNGYKPVYESNTI